MKFLFIEFICIKFIELGNINVFINRLLKEYINSVCFLYLFQIVEKLGKISFSTGETVLVLTEKILL
jgi:hypothetical protein